MLCLDNSIKILNDVSGFITMIFLFPSLAFIIFFVHIISVFCVLNFVTYLVSFFVLFFDMPILCVCFYLCSFLKQLSQSLKYIFIIHSCLLLNSIASLALQVLQNKIFLIPSPWPEPWWLLFISLNSGTHVWALLFWISNY